MTSILASGYLDKTNQLWDISSGQRIRTFEGGHTAVYWFCWSLDLMDNGQILASDGWDQKYGIGIGQVQNCWAKSVFEAYKRQSKHPLKGILTKSSVLNRF